MGDLDALRSRIAELEADNAHLLGMLKISKQESRRPGAAPTVIFDAAPGTVTAESPARHKVALYASLFRARSDVYAVRWDSDRTGRGGWMPAVQGGFRKGVRPADRRYLAAHGGGGHAAPVGRPGDRPVPAAGRRPVEAPRVFVRLEGGEHCWPNGLPVTSASVSPTLGDGRGPGPPRAVMYELQQSRVSRTGEIPLPGPV